jgi:hypothetical protein
MALAVDMRWHSTAQRWFVVFRLCVGLDYENRRTLTDSALLALLHSHGWL